MRQPGVDTGSGLAAQEPALGGGSAAGKLLHADANALAVDQFVEDGQDFFAKVIDSFNTFAEVAVIERMIQPAVEDVAGNLDVAAQLLGVVAAQKEPVEHGGFALDVQWIEIFPPLWGDLR